ncbi:rhomboid-like protein 11, chloroplastic isoform X2 [Elaeis guineensis]|uniref:Rhomboid-like protein 11, chloroplastic isoform X2 n=1 Tax=Elaeis guineensis var. tenera TaxID=51953 RepID=A0A6I9RNI5_ELAGV|nr:rhomboid-like protein 11, chloroplastic isoform X2 [Elaeis guineensis]
MGQLHLLSLSPVSAVGLLGARRTSVLGAWRTSTAPAAATSVAASFDTLGRQSFSSHRKTAPFVARRGHFFCKMGKPELELARPEEKREPDKRVNGIFWILLLNLGIYVADHLFRLQKVKTLYLYHGWPSWYQFVTATFCHANWQHLSSNLFFLYIFGKLVEEEEGNLALWISYILTGAGANLISWLVLPRSAVSVGASGAVFGLFAISVLVKISWDWRKIIEVLVLGQFVIDKVLEASTGLTDTWGTGYAFPTVNHIAHLSGALIGAALILLVRHITSQPSGQDIERDKRT